MRKRHIGYGKTGLTLCGIKISELGKSQGKPEGILEELSGICQSCGYIAHHLSIPTDQNKDIQDVMRKLKKRHNIS